MALSTGKRIITIHIFPDIPIRKWERQSENEI